MQTSHHLALIYGASPQKSCQGSARVTLPGFDIGALAVRLGFEVRLY